MVSLKKQTNKGFSLIELLVSLSIFTIVITMAVGTLLVLIDANAKAQNIQSSLTNILFSLDSMTREIRTGSTYHCLTDNGSGQPSTNPVTANDCSTGFGANFISITEGGNSLTGSGATGADARISYYYDADYDHDPDPTAQNQKGTLLRRIGNGSWQPLNSAQVDIQSFGLYVDGSTPASSGNYVQPSAVIIIEGQAGELAEVDTTFTLQAYITQRQLDI